MMGLESLIQKMDLFTNFRLGHLEEAKKKLKQGESVLQANQAGYTPLHYAAKWGEVECLKLALEYGATLDAKDCVGWTPLHCAAGDGHVDCVRLLLKAGALIAPLDYGGETPLHKAVRFGHLEVVYAMIEMGADPHDGTPNKSLRPTHLEQAVPLDVRAKIDEHLKVAQEQWYLKKSIPDAPHRGGSRL